MLPEDGETRTAPLMDKTEDDAKSPELKGKE